jgi:hypothetical protein
MLVDLVVDLLLGCLFLLVGVLSVMFCWSSSWLIICFVGRLVDTLFAFLFGWLADHLFVG